MEQQLTSAGLAALLGAVLSFLLAAVPGLTEAWDKVPYKRWVMFATFVLAPFAIFAIDCYGVYNLPFTCPAGAFVSVPFYVDNLVMGLSAFAGSQWGYTNGARTVKNLPH